MPGVRASIQVPMGSHPAFFGDEKGIARFQGSLTIIAVGEARIFGHVLTQAQSQPGCAREWPLLLPEASAACSANASAYTSRQ